MRFRSTLTWGGLLLTLCAALFLMAALNSENILRPFFATIFVLLCPGLAWVRVMQLKAWYVELTLGLTLSIAILAVVAMLMLYTGTWSMQNGLLMLIVIAVTGLIAEVLSIQFTVRGS